MKKTNEKGKLLNLFRTKKFIEDNYEADKQLIIDKYNELGYRDAIIVTDSIKPYDDRTVDIFMQIEEGQKVCLNGKPVEKDKKDKLILLAVNKPRGVVCSEKSQGGDVNIIDFLHYPKRITYVGRLDKDSEGCFS